jgi:tetratricopeptide (TPR) repeat protein
MAEADSPLDDSPPVPEPSVPEQNEAVYDRLISLIENTQGRLAPIIVACDDFKLRQRLIERYEQDARAAKIQPYRIVLGEEPSMRAGLAKLKAAHPYLQTGGEAVFTVTGAEVLLRIKLDPTAAQSELDKFFGYLQWTREGLLEFTYPMVLWVTYRILREMSLRSPDFWSWRKAVLRFGTELSPLVDRAGQRLEPVERQEPEDEFLPPLAELQAEIAQLMARDAEAVGLATLYDKLGHVYARRISRGEAQNLEQEREGAIAAFQQSIARHQTSGNASAQANSLNRLGNFLDDQSRFYDAIDCHQQSLEIKREIGDRKGEAASLNGLGIAYRSLGQYQRAIDFHQQSLAIKREIGDRHGEANSLSGLGSAYYSLGQYQRAIDFHQQSLEIKREIGDRHGEANSLNGLGNAYRSLGQYQRAIDFYQQCLEIQREIGNRNGEAASLGNLGNAYGDLGQHQRAIDFYQQCLEIQREIGDRNDEGGSLCNLGIAYAALGQYQQAIDFYQQALIIQREVGNRLFEANTLFNQGKALAKYEPRRFEAFNTFKQVRAIYSDLKLDHKVKECDSEIYAFNQRIATQHPHRAPKIDDGPPRRPVRRKIHWVFWGGVGVAAALLLAFLLKR